MWGTESKHKCYKGIFAANFRHWLTDENGGSQFSTRLLPRLALRHMELWNDRPLTPGGFVLEQLFSDIDIQKETGLVGVLIARRCRIGILDLQEKDLILWGPSFERAGICHFFLEKKAELYVYLSQYKFAHGTDSVKTFHITQEKLMVKWKCLDNVKTCSWWRQINSHVQCLP